jgi:hypothetical protein
MIAAMPFLEFLGIGKLPEVFSLLHCDWAVLPGSACADSTAQTSCTIAPPGLYCRIIQYALLCTLHAAFCSLVMQYVAE